MSDVSELKTTTSQWLEAIQPVVRYPEAKTLAELAVELGIPRSTLSGKLEKAIKDGLCRKYQDYRKGRMANVYVLLKPKSLSGTKK